MFKSNKHKTSEILAVILGVASLLAAPSTFASFSRRANEDESKNIAAREGKQPLVQTDVEAVLNSGNSSTPVASQQLFLPPGLYALGPSSTEESDHYLIVERSINNDAMGLAILLPKKPSNYHRGTFRSGFIFQIRPIHSGSAIMLAPIGIDAEGNPKTITEDSTHMPYLEIELGAENGKGLHFPYVVTPIHGALSSIFGVQELVLRPTLINSPVLADYPKTGQFTGWSDTGQSIFVSKDQVKVADGSSEINKFKMIPMNGSEFGGKFFQLARTDDNSITGENQSSTKIERMAVYLNGCFSEHFLVFTPRNAEGEYAIHVYIPRKKTIADFLLPISPRRY